MILALLLSVKVRRIEVVEVLVVKPSHEQGGNLESFPLRCHVSDTVNGGKVQSVVACDLALELVVHKPRCSFARDSPVKTFNPLPCSPGRNCTISVSGVDQNLESVVLELWVEPDRSSFIPLVRVSHLSIAVDPDNSFVHMQCCFDVHPVEVVVDFETFGERVGLISAQNPGRVLFLRVACLVGDRFSVYFDCAFTGSGRRLGNVVASIEIIDIKLRGIISELVRERLASLFLVKVIGCDRIEGTEAFSSDPLFVQSRWNNLEACHCVE